MRRHPGSNAGRKGRPSHSPLRDFSRVYREGRRFPGVSVVLYFRPTGVHRRIGVTTGRGFGGGAVARNRAKRRLRAAFRRLEGRLCDQGDIILVARPPALTAGFSQIVAEVEALCAAGRLLAEEGT